MDNVAVHNVIIILVAIPVMLVATGLMAQILLRYVISYDIRGGKIRVLLFHIVPMYWISISNIREAEYFSPRMFVMPPFSLEAVFALRFGNRTWGDGIILKRKRRWAPSVIISPDNSRAFVEQIRTILKWGE